MFTIRTFVKGDKTIRIYGVSHVSRQENYDKLYERVKADHAQGFTIHHEGLRVPTTHFGLNHAYQKFAQGIGIATQPRVDLTWMEVQDLTFSTLTLKDKIAIRSMFLFARAVFPALGSLVSKSDDDFKEAFITALEKDWKMRDSQTTKLPFPFAKALHQRRERYAAGKAMTSPGSIAMIWGLAHVPGFTRVLEQRGYTLTSLEQL